MLRYPTVLALGACLSLFACRQRAARGGTAAAPAHVSEAVTPAIPTPLSGDIPSSQPQKISTEQLHRRTTVSVPLELHSILGEEPGTVLVHDVDPRAQTVLNGDHGTVITLYPNTLILPNGEAPSGPVTVTLREYYTPGEILAAGLSTQSEGRLLETGGMVYIDANADGQRCRLRRGAVMDIDFPYEKKKEGMQLFTGSWSGNTVNWNAFYNINEDNFYYRQARVYQSVKRSLQEYLEKTIAWPDDTEVPITWWDAIVHFTVNAEGNAHVVRVEEPMSASFASNINDAFDAHCPGVVAWEDGLPATAAFSQHVTFRWREDRNNPGVAIELAPLHLDSITRGKGPARYTFRTPVLGWINCDRFYNDTRERTELMVKAGPADEMDAKLLFHSINSILGGTRAQDQVLFSEIPKGETVTLIVTKKIKEQFFFSSSECVVGQEVPVPRFEAVTKEQLKQRLAAVTRGPAPAEKTPSNMKTI